MGSRKGRVLVTAKLFDKSDLTVTEAAKIEGEYNREGWKTVREEIRFNDVIFAETISLYRDQYGDGWEKQKTWDID